jgi:hypothetical protein
LNDWDYLPGRNPELGAFVRTGDDLVEVAFVFYLKITCSFRVNLWGEPYRMGVVKMNIWNQNGETITG